MAKSLRCSDAGFNCPAVFTTEDQDELMKHVALHAGESHPEVELTPELASQVQTLIRTV